MRNYNMLTSLATILLMPEAAEGRFVDPLDANVDDVDTSYPVLAQGNYNLRIKSAKKQPNKAQTGENLVIAFETIDSARSNKGVDIAPGFVITHYISVTPREPEGEKRGYTVEDIKKSVAELAKAAKVKGSVREIIDNAVQFEGTVVNAKVKIQPEQNGFPESNRINGFNIV